MDYWISVVVAAPAHSAVAGPLTYRCASALAPGTLVRVPLGAREVLGVVWENLASSGSLPEAQARDVAGTLEGLGPLGTIWRRLISFTSAYYQRSLGEVALAALPPQLREMTAVQLARRLRRPVQDTSSVQIATDLVALSPEQSTALAEFDGETRPALLFGATGSGKTEVYLRAAAAVLARDPDAQVLVMVPEINLTPQLQARFEVRFSHLGKERVVALHSGLTPAQRLKSWLAAHAGHARLVLGTRMAVLASMPCLRLIVVDEEHDPSYKQQEGARYSARDLAVMRAKLETEGAALTGGTCRVMLGSATPSLESWQSTLTGRYQRLTMNQRIGAAQQPDEEDAAADNGSDSPFQQGPRDWPIDPASRSGNFAPFALRYRRAIAEGERFDTSARTVETLSGRSNIETTGAAAFSSGGETPPLFMPSKPASAGSEPRHEAPSGLAAAAPPPHERAWTASRGAASGSVAPRKGRALHAVNDRGGLPLFRGIDMNHQPRHCIVAPPLLEAITQRIARGEQSMIFLNRRGYAPVLACHDCGWKSECPHCSAYRVFHKIDRTLRCHHCGFTERVPRACPSCGNIDIAPVGRGTERLEEHIAELLADIRRPDGGAVRISRIDADTTRLKGALESQLASVHAGEVDVLVGTQMIAKGHDFRHITLVAAINPDGALFSSDFRAPERLFSLLMQAAGRAGRDARQAAASEMWVQTFYPAHPLFACLKRHDYPAFATQQLAERQAAGLPPFGFSALVRAEAKTQEVAQGFLNAASAAALAAPLPAHEQVTLYPAVPMMIQRIANIERAQMLVESASRAALQTYLSQWQAVLFDTRKQPEYKSLVRWAIDVDPIAI